MVRKTTQVLGLLLALFFCEEGRAQDQQGSNTGVRASKAVGDKRVENLRKTVEEFRRAFGSNDFERFADLTVPEVIKQVGGRETFISVTKSVVEMNPKIFEDFSLRFGDPDQLVESDELLLAVVPQTIEGVTFQKHKVVNNGSIVGVSNDGGTSWKFASGEKFFDTFPRLVGKLTIPKETTTVDGIKR